MALVPAGCFDMGDNGAGGRQCLPLFFIDVFEVTNQQFTDKAGFAVQSSYFAPGDQPRERISWIEARGFCEKRGGRLPTEAEWEYAARGPDNLLYPWGNTFDPRYAIYRLNSDFHTWPVGGNRLTSWVGASDMSGNVREWTNSIYLDYPFNPTDGRESLNTVDPSSARVIRGGSWNSLEGDLVLTQRDRLLPYNSEYTVGFRCVRSFSGS
jgi:formylglycine-generating enzyme required for sulfatase activity